MIQTYNNVHEALKNDATQHIILSFDDATFTDGDVSLSDRVGIRSAFCTENNLTYGQTPSTEITFSLFNDDGTLNDFDFGKFQCYLGTVVKSGTISDNFEDVTLDDDDYTYTYSDSGTYSIDDDGLKINGTLATVQPGFSVMSIFNLNDGYLRCFGSDGQVFACTVNGNSDVTTTLYTDTELKSGVRYLKGLAKVQAVRFANKGLGVWYDSTSGLAVLTYAGSRYEVCVFSQIGEFWAEKPTKVRISRIAITGYDAMVAKMEIAMDDFTFTSPITITNFFNLFLTYCGIEATNDTKTLIANTGGSREVTFGEMKTLEPTAREVLGLIAEACAANAMFDNTGKLMFKRLSSIGVTVRPSEYSDFAPSSYFTEEIDKLQIRFSDNDIGVSYGTGTNTYIIQENPFIEYDSDSAGTAIAQMLYNAIYRSAYCPSSIRWFGDYTVQPGDIVSVSYEDETFDLPIFTLDNSWGGISIITAESTGDKQREQINFNKRESFVTNKKIAEVYRTIDYFEQTYKEYVDGQDELLSSRITQNATAIETEVTRASTAEGNLSTRITQNATDISSEVTRATTAEGNLSTRITQTETAITTEVTRATTAEGNLSTRITQNANSITSEVTRATAAEGNLSTRITQTETDISSKVSKNGVISEINQSSETITIDANRIKVGTFTYGDAGNGITNAYYTGGAYGSSTFTGFSANTDWAFWAGNGVFRVTQAGKVYASDGDFAGTFKAGNWVFNDSGLACTVSQKNILEISCYLDTTAQIMGGYNQSDGYRKDIDIYGGNVYLSVDKGGGYVMFGLPNVHPSGTVGTIAQIAFVYDSNGVRIYDYASSTTNPRGVLGGGDTPFYTVVTQYLYQLSSRKVKKDIEYLSSVESQINRLKPASFRYRNDESLHYGLIYEDTLETMPELCKTPETEDGIGTINYLDIIGLLVRSNQELYERLEKLEAKVA